MRPKNVKTCVSESLYLLRYGVMAIVLTAMSGSAIGFDGCPNGQGDLFQITNYWGRDFVRYKAGVARTMKSDTAALGAEMSQLFMTVAALPVPTNDISVYRCWMREKTFLLGATVRYLQAESNTDRWLEVAQLLGEIRSLKRTREQIVKELQSSDSDSRIGKSIAERRRWLRRETGLRSALVQAEENLLPAVVETIGCRFLPQLDIHRQHILLSNIVARAQLMPSEVKRIEDAIVMAARCNRESSSTHEHDAASQKTENNGSVEIGPNRTAPPPRPVPNWRGTFLSF